MPAFIVRPMTASEYPLLREFLRLAIHVPHGAEPPPADLIDTEPVLRRYWEDFGTRPGDHALVAVADNTVIGVATARILGGEHPGYGHVDDETPELDISVQPAWRGRGVGTSLLTTLLDDVRAAGHPRVSLSVDKDNTGARQLYERLGFVVVAGLDDPERTDLVLVNMLVTP